MRHRLPVRLILAAVLALLVTGCAKKPEPPVAALPPSALDLVSERGELRVCSTGEARPFSVRDTATGRWSGSDVELAGDLATRLEVKLALVPTTTAAMLDDLAAAKCDIVMSGVQVSLELARRAAYSQPYLVEGKAPVVRCADVPRFQTLEQIDRPGVRAAAIDGFARDRLRKATVAPAPNPATAGQEILAGRADVSVLDVAEARAQARQNPGRLCAVNPERPLGATQRAYLLPRGDVVFQQFVDTWLRTAQADGTFARATRPSAG